MRRRAYERMFISLLDFFVGSECWHSGGAPTRGDCLIGTMIGTSIAIRISFSASSRRQLLPLNLLWLSRKKSLLVQDSLVPTTTVDAVIARHKFSDKSCDEFVTMSVMCCCYSYNNTRIPEACGCIGYIATARHSPESCLNK